MSAVAVERKDRHISLNLEASRHETLLALAAAKFNGVAVDAIRHLIDLYAGVALERAKQEQEDAQAYHVVRYKSGRLTEELIGYVAGLVRAGFALEDAYAMAGVTKRQASAWTKAGRNDLASEKESLKADLISTIERAQAECKAENIAKIRSAASSDWRAAGWLLSRQFPDQYAERKRVDSNVKHTVMAMIDYDRLNLTEARVLVELLRKASPEPDDASLGAARRPVAELVPGEILETIDLAPESVVDLDESPTARSPNARDESPSASNASQSAQAGPSGAGAPAAARSGDAPGDDVDEDERAG